MLAGSKGATTDVFASYCFDFKNIIYVISAFVDTITLCIDTRQAVGNFSGIIVVLTFK